MKKFLSSFCRPIKHIIGTVWNTKNGKLIILFKAIAIIFNTITPTLIVLLPGLIINELTGEKRVRILCIYVILLVAAPLANALINLLIKIVSTRAVNAFALTREINYNKNFLQMDYEMLEQPETYNLAIRARYSYINVHEKLNIVCNLISAILSIVALSTMIGVLNPPIIILIIFVILANSLVTRLVNKKTFSYRKEESMIHREGSHLVDHVRNGRCAKETRLYDISSFLLDLITFNIHKWNKIKFKVSMIEEIPFLFQTVTNMIQGAIIYAFLIYSVIENNLGIGYLAIFLAATGQFANVMKSISQSVLSLQEENDKLNDMQKFLDIPLTQYDSGNLTPIFDKNSEIRFENVSFKYPGSENYALKNINLTFRGDEKLCIVGHNGAGKSTFTKLLSRLYSPTEGTIYLNGINIMEYKYTEYQHLFSAVFQETELFTLTLGQNISLDHSYDKARIDEVCEKTGLSNLVRKLPKGYDTMVTKMLDHKGIDPSGGEKQRIVIARALYHSAPIYLLDEPTAALDPLIEYEIYMQFSNMIADSAAILVTHRLSAVKLADKVALFEDGRLIEHGTHQELYDKNGKYYEMYEKQAQFYMK